MIKTIASIQADCERLGLVEDSRVLKAWLSHNLPHLSEETELLKEIYDLCSSINTLPPSSVPQASLSLQTLPYHTTGKSVRQIMGELGYLIYLVYQQGFSQHNIHDLPDGIRSNHIKLGIIIQDLIVLFGIYYNAANRKEDVLAAEAEQMFNLWNTHIGSLVTKLAESLIRTREHSLEMLETEGAKRFIEDNEDLKKQTLSFFKDIDQIILEIRKSFYQKSQLSFSEISNVQSLLQKLRDFLNSLKAITSGLDLESGRYNPEALMYWSIVFSKKQEGHKSGKQKRTEIAQDLLDKPYLSEYAVNLESSSNLFKVTANDIVKAHKDFRENLKTVVVINDKIRQTIIEAMSLRKSIENFVPVMSLLKTAMMEVHTAHASEKLSSEQFAVFVQEELNKNKKIVPEFFTTKPSISAILSRYLSFYPKKSIHPDKPDLKNFGIDKEIEALKDLLEITDRAIKTAYASWRGVFSLDPINNLHSKFYHIANDFQKIAENPLGQLNDYEKEMVDVLQVGKIFKEDGSFSAGFENVASNILQTKLYSKKTKGTEQEKKTDIAHKITDFNALLKALLTDTELSEDLDIESLQSFVENIVKELRQVQIEKINEGSVPSSSLEAIIAELQPIINIEDWLKETNVVAKGSLEELKDIARLGRSAGFNNSNLKKAILVAAEEKALSIAVVRQGPSGLEEGLVKIDVDRVSRKLTYRLDLKSSSGNFIVGRPQSKDLCPIEEFSQEVFDILKNLRVDSTKNLTVNKEKIQSWYKEKIELSNSADKKIEQEIKPEIESEIKPEIVPKPKMPISLEPIKDRNLEVVDKKDKSGKAVRPEKIREYAVTLNPAIPGCLNNDVYLNLLTTRIKTLGTYERRIMDTTQQNFSFLMKIVDQATAVLLDSEGLLPAFPRITYNVYSRTSTASESWKEWKATKIEVPLHEIETLVENLVATEKIREEFTESPIENLKGIPLVTIDRIDEKFEELIKLVRQ
jgi:hypothetical protein